MSVANASHSVSAESNGTHSSLSASQSLELMPRTRASESAARAALDSLCGSNLTDMEWGRSRTRLLEFVGILREWDRKDQPANSVLGNVEVLCQRER